MRFGSRLIGIGLLTLLTACGGGGDASLDGKTQVRMDGNKSQSGVDGSALTKNEPNIQTDLNQSGVTVSSTTPNNSESAPANGTQPATQRVRLGSFSSYTPTGWIDDQFTRAWVFTFVGGGGGGTYNPPKNPNPIPPTYSELDRLVQAYTANMGGLDAYRAPAVPLNNPGPYNPTPYDSNWYGPALSGDWHGFLYNSMACAPACAIMIADTLITTPAARISYGPPSGTGGPSMGDDDLNGMVYNINHPRFDQNSGLPLTLLATAIDYHHERLLAAWAALEKLIDKATGSTGRKEYQYALVTDRAGSYPDVRYGYVKMKKLEVWKYGTSFDPETRYSKAYLTGLGLSMVIQSEGTREQVLAMEKAKLINYYTFFGELPPGNKIFK